MAWTNAKMAIVVGVGILLAAGTITVTVKEFQRYKSDDSWRVQNFDSRVLDRAAPQVKILPTKFPSFGGWGSSEDKVMGIATSVKDIVGLAYGQSPARTIFSTELPSDRYDFIASLPSENRKALQQEIRKKFGMTARRETRETGVLLLKTQNSDASGLKPADPRRLGSHEGSSSSAGAGYYTCRNVPVSNLAGFLENHFDVPVIDQTSLTNRFDIDLKWSEQDWQHPNLENLKQALIDQLGLELVPSREPIEMLIVEKVK